MPVCDVDAHLLEDMLQPSFALFAHWRAIAPFLQSVAATRTLSKVGQNGFICISTSTRTLQAAVKIADSRVVLHHITRQQSKPTPKPSFPNPET